MSSTGRRRPALLTALALLLAIEAVTTVAVRAAEINDARTQLAAVAAVGAMPAAPRIAPFAPAQVPAALRPPVHDARRSTDALAPAASVAIVRVAPARRAMPAPVVRTEVVRPKARPASTTPSNSPAPSRRARLIGRNHVWSPALGIDKRVYAFPCSRAQKPGNVVYRWGCAGRNNVYLMGHAANVFGSLDRAYHDGRLRRGLKVYYADAGGTVRTYAVRWWKVVEPTPDAAWAWASLSSPSMTLQTCTGRNSQYRLMVRLAQVG
jgi:hypothetical protein